MQSAFVYAGTFITGYACRRPSGPRARATRPHIGRPARTTLASNPERNSIQVMFASSKRPEWTRTRIHVKAPHGHRQHSLQDRAPLVTQRWFCRPVNPAQTRGSHLFRRCRLCLECSAGRTNSPAGHATYTNLNPRTERGCNFVSPAVSFSFSTFSWISQLPVVIGVFLELSKRDWMTLTFSK